MCSEAPRHELTGKRLRLWVVTCVSACGVLFSIAIGRHEIVAGAGTSQAGPALFAGALLIKWATTIILASVSLCLIAIAVRILCAGGHFIPKGYISALLALPLAAAASAIVLAILLLIQTAGESYLHASVRSVGPGEAFVLTIRYLLAGPGGHSAIMAAILASFGLTVLCGAALVWSARPREHR
jgi:NADH:ubiquinone oxidoreductase subunit K